jgi:hypothetical protein
MKINIHKYIMSNVYGIAGATERDTINEGIRSYNEKIMDINTQNRKQFTKDIGTLRTKAKGTDTKLQKLQDAGESALDAGYGAMTAISAGAKKVRDIRGALGEAKATRARRGAFLAESADAPSARVGEAFGPSSDKVVSDMVDTIRKVSATNRPIESDLGGEVASANPNTATADSGEALRRAEALPDAGIAREVQGGAVELGTTVEAGRGLGLTGTDFPEGLDLPSVAGPTPTRFTRPAFAETAQRAGRQALQTSEGGVLSGLESSRRAVERARGGESFESISGLQGRELNPASRLRAGEGTLISGGERLGEAGQVATQSGGGVLSGATNLLKEDDIRPASYGLAPARPIGTVGMPTYRPELNTQAIKPAESVSSAEGGAGSTAEDVAETVEQGEKPVVKSGLSVAKEGLGKALQVANIAQGGYDAYTDIVNGKIAGANNNERASNVLGMVSGGLDATAFGAGSIAGALESAGAVADATGLGAPIGLALGLAGAGVGVASAVEDLIGKKKEKSKVKAQLQSQLKKGPSALPQEAFQAGTSGEVRQAQQGIGAVS